MIKTFIQTPPRRPAGPRTLKTGSAGTDRAQNSKDRGHFLSAQG